MDEKKIHKKFLNEDPPIDIPSADEAWREMRKKLDEEEQEKRPVAGRWLYPAIIIFLFTGFGWWILQSSYFSGSSNSDKKVVSTQGNTLPFNDEKGKLYNKTDGSGERETQPINDGSGSGLESRPTKLSGQNVSILKQKKAKNDPRQKDKLRKSSRKEPEPLQALKSKSKVVDEFKSEGISKGDIDINKTKDSGLGIDTANSKKSGAEDVAESEKEEKEKVIIQAGLQWSAQLPINASKDYFAGPDGSSQPYRLLLPAGWVSLQVEKYLFTIEANPFATSVLGNKPYSTKNITRNSVTISETETLNKIFGLNAGVSVNYNIKNKWWLGGNVKANFWRKGKATVKGVNANVSSGSDSVVYENDYTLNDSAWTGFTKFQMGTGLQLIYKQNKWQAGIQFDFYPVPLVDKEGQKNNIDARLFFRYSLYTFRKTK